MADRTAVSAQRSGADFSFPVSDSPCRLSERELARLWHDQTFPPEALVTGDGDKLRVIYRGRSSGGPGPDFRDVLIAAPRGLLRGDVELHVRSSDFQRHGHQRDPAYAGVILHLVFWDDERRPTALPGGGTAPVAALAGWVEGRAAEIARWLERPALWREPCFSALAQEGPAQVMRTLDRLGDMRFRRKAAALVPVIAREGEEEALWQALLEALAFGPDRQTFRLLGRRVCWAALRARLRALPSTERAAEALRLLEAGLVCLPALDRAARRPANRPARRLAGAARLAARLSEKGLAVSFLDLFRDEVSEGQRDETKSENAKIANTSSERRRKRARGRLPVSSFEFRVSGQTNAERKTAASLLAALTVPGLVGRGRAVEMVANAVLPWLAALSPEQRVRRAEAVFARLPLPARYGAVRHLHEAVGAGPGRDTREPQDEWLKSKTEAHSEGVRVTSVGFHGGKLPQAAVPINFRRQQGMLYLLNDYCTQGGCGRCPLS